MGSGFEGFDFSYEGVKWVIGLLIGFVFAIASAPCGFLYLNQLIHDKNIKIKTILTHELLKANYPPAHVTDSSNQGIYFRNKVVTQ